MSVYPDDAYIKGGFKLATMKQVMIKKGEIVIEDVPAPVPGVNSLQVEVRYSLVSTGTEMAGLALSGESLARKIMDRPDRLKKALDMIRAKGLSRTFEKIKERLEIAHPVGYSCSGIVTDVGNGVPDVEKGDRVACAGAGYANHAEVICVPKNLVAKIPDDLGFREAAAITIGAIALQGVRRTDPRIGEFVCVIGLGLIGQISVQLLKASGCRVAGVDVDKQRVDEAKTFGLDFGICTADEDPVAAVLVLTGGYGSDATIITAATPSDQPANQAIEMTRKKGRVVLVGDVGLHLEREPFYERELDFLISTSYGPGRYDPSYEEHGLDYPYAYVRWTENRNMQEILRLISENRIVLPISTLREFAIEDAPAAYEALKKEPRPLGVFLKYRAADDGETPIVKWAKKIAVSPRFKPGAVKDMLIHVALIGAGGIAREVHLPNLARLKNNFYLHSVVDANPSVAKSVAEKYGAVLAASDYRAVLEDKAVDLVMICTRHNLHASIIIDALNAGKHVFVEKPLCLNSSELERIIEAYLRAVKNNKVLTVGFNRRFSPYAARIKEITSKRTSPMMINYRMNAGFIPGQHWVHTGEGGGRNIGEACHIYDLFNFFAESEVDFIDAVSIAPKRGPYLRNDNFVATVRYREGSVCNLLYTAMGNPAIPKELMDVYIDGKIFQLEDYRRVRIAGRRRALMERRTQDKGHLEELTAIARSIARGGDLPIPFDTLIQATTLSFEIEKLIWTRSHPK